MNILCPESCTKKQHSIHAQLLFRLYLDLDFKLEFVFQSIFFTSI